MAIAFNLQGIPSQIRGTAEEAGAVPDLGQALMQGFRSNIENIQGYPRQLAQQLLANQLANKIKGVEAKYAEPTAQASLQSQLLQNKYYPRIQESNLATASLGRQGQQLSNQMAAFNLQKAQYQKQLFESLINQGGMSIPDAHIASANIVANDPRVQAQEKLYQTALNQPTQGGVPYRMPEQQSAQQTAQPVMQQAITQQQTQQQRPGLADIMMRSEIRQNPLYAGAIKEMLGIDITKETPREKMQREIQEKAQLQMNEADIKTIQNLESDLPLINDKIRNLSRMKEIAKKYPQYFGPLNQFSAKISNIPELGEYTDLLSDFVQSKQSELSERGSQAALKAALGFKPNQSDPAKQVLGKLDSALRKMINERDRATRVYQQKSGRSPDFLYGEGEYFTPKADEQQLPAAAQLTQNLNTAIEQQPPEPQNLSPLQKGLQKWQQLGAEGIPKGFAEGIKQNIAALTGAGITKPEYAPQTEGFKEQLGQFAATSLPALVGGVAGSAFGPIGTVAGTALGDVLGTQGGLGKRALSGITSAALLKALPYAAKTFKGLGREIMSLRGESEPIKAVLNQIQNKYNTLYNKSIGLYDKVRDEVLSRKIKPFKLNETILNKIQPHIPDEPEMLTMFDAAKKGSYDAIHNLQTYLRKRGEKMVDSLEQDTHKLGKSFLGWRNEINKDVEKHLAKTGNKDLTSDLQEGRQIYKDLMTIYHPDESPQISEMFRIGVKREPSNLQEFFNPKDEPMRKFLHEHPAISKAREIELNRMKLGKRAKKIAGVGIGTGLGGFGVKKGFDILTGN
jgi:hypothetical protein